MINSNVPLDFKAENGIGYWRVRGADTWSPFNKYLGQAVYIKKEIPAIDIYITGSHWVGRNSKDKSYEYINVGISITVDTEGVYLSASGTGSMSSDAVLTLSSSNNGTGRYTGTYTCEASATLNAGYTYIPGDEISTWTYPNITITGTGSAASGNSSSGNGAEGRTSSHRVTINCGTLWTKCTVNQANTNCSVSFSEGVLTITDSAGSSEKQYSYSRTATFSVTLSV